MRNIIPILLIYYHNNIVVSYVTYLFNKYYYGINIDNLDYIQYNMLQSWRTVTDFELCMCYIYNSLWICVGKS